MTLFKQYVEVLNKLQGGVTKYDGSAGDLFMDGEDPTNVYNKMYKLLGMSINADDFYDLHKYIERVIGLVSTRIYRSTFTVQLLSNGLVLMADNNETIGATSGTFVKVHATSYLNNL